MIAREFVRNVFRDVVANVFDTWYMQRILKSNCVIWMCWRHLE